MKEVKVGVGIRYETTANINDEDGLTNGSSCLVQKITYLTEQNPIPSIVWVQIDSNIAGA